MQGFESRGCNSLANPFLSRKETMEILATNKNCSWRFIRYIRFSFSRVKEKRFWPRNVCIYVYIREENCFIDEALESNNWRVGTERENRIKIFGTSIDVHASIKSGDCAVVSKHEFPINKGDRSRRVVQPVELSPRANENGFYVILISHGKWKPLKYRSRHSRNFFA